MNAADVIADDYLRRYPETARFVAQGLARDAIDALADAGFAVVERAEVENFRNTVEEDGDYQRQLESEVERLRDRLGDPADDPYLSDRLRDARILRDQAWHHADVVERQRDEARSERDRYRSESVRQRGENERLKREYDDSRASASRVTAGIQELGKILGVPPGHAIHGENSAERARKIVAERNEARAVIKRVRAVLRRLDDDVQGSETARVCGLLVSDAIRAEGLTHDEADTSNTRTRKP